MPGVDHDRRLAADAVQIEVHRAHAADLWRQLHAFGQAIPERSLFVGVEVALVAVQDILICVTEEAAGACRGIADRVDRGRLHRLANRLDHRPRGEILARAARGFLRRARQQFLVNCSLHVHRQGQPVHLVEQVDDQLLQERWIVDFAARPLEDDTEHAGLDAELFKAVAVLVLQRCAV